MILYNTEARQKLIQGVTKIADAVKSTLGPKGRNVILKSGLESPHITKDGVTVAESIYLEDPVEQVAVDIIKQAAAKTAQEAGDGTTSSTIIAESIITQGLSEDVSVKKLQAAANKVLDFLKNNVEKITEQEDIFKVATVASNGDEELAALITGTLLKVGQHGLVSIQQSATSTTHVKETLGISFDRGYISPHLLTGNDVASRFIEPYILVTDQAILTPKNIGPILEKTMKRERPILIVADSISPDVIKFLAMNQLNTALACMAVQAPSFGVDRKNILEDIAITTNASVVSDLSRITFDDLGRADRTIVDVNSTSIIGGRGDDEAIQERISALKAQYAAAVNQKDPSEHQLGNRLAKLTGGSSVIYVGASTEIELKEKTDRVEDAVHATRAAIKSGILPGGGLTLYRASEILSEELEDQIIAKACQEPLKQLLRNAEVEEDVLTKLKKVSPNTGYNIRTGQYENLRKSGIIDPARVTISAFSNAVSVATTLLTTECLVYNDTRKLQFPSPSFTNMPR